MKKLHFTIINLCATNILNATTKNTNDILCPAKELYINSVKEIINSPSILCKYCNHKNFINLNKCSRCERNLTKSKNNLRYLNLQIKLQPTKNRDIIRFFNSLKKTIICNQLIIKNYLEQSLKNQVREQLEQQKQSLQQQVENQQLQPTNPLLLKIDLDIRLSPFIHLENRFIYPRAERWTKLEKNISNQLGNQLKKRLQELIKQELEATKKSDLEYVKQEIKKLDKAQISLLEQNKKKIKYLNIDLLQKQKINLSLNLKLQLQLSESITISYNSVNNIENILPNTMIKNKEALKIEILLNLDHFYRKRTKNSL